MKINYPVKYTVMPIYEQVGWTPGLHELEREYDVVCYIVSKCYLIGDFTKYKENGDVVKEYDVVFPYQLIEFDRFKRVEPIYNSTRGCCVNSNIVDVVFNSYEEALDYATVKNKKLCENTWIYLLCSKDIMDKIQEKENEFNKRLEKYKLLEEQILINTEDMEIGKNKKLDNVIRVVNNCGKIFSCSIYTLLNLFNNDRYLVYSISQEEYDNLISLITSEKDNIEGIINGAKGILVHDKNADFIKLNIEDKDGCYYIQNNRISYDCGLDMITNNDFENIDKDTLIFYTTETMEDILRSYEKHLEIDLMQVSKHVLKKKK